MATVIRAFKERFHEFKLYKPGDTYPDGDKERVQYLTDQGFLDSSEQSDPPSFELFLSMSATDQKKILSLLSIDGDDSNAEKREALYKQFLGTLSDPEGSTDPKNAQGDSEDNKHQIDADEGVKENDSNG